MLAWLRSETDVPGQWLHALIDDLYVNDGRSMLETHLFGEQTVDRLCRRPRQTCRCCGCSGGRGCAALRALLRRRWRRSHHRQLLLLLLLLVHELKRINVDDARVRAHPQRVGLLLRARYERAHKVHVAYDRGRYVVHGLELA